MGIMRGIWRSTLMGRTIDTVKNMVDEGSIVEGYKRTIKENFTEDNPIGKAIYDSGKHDGKKEGYQQASDEYEKKLLKQADEFIEQKKIYESERDAYENLLDEYEKAIEELENKVNRTETENAFLQELLSRERRLRKLA